MRTQISILACVAILGCLTAPQPKAAHQQPQSNELDVNQLIQAVIDFLDDIDIDDLLNNIPDEDTRQRVFDAVEALKQLVDDSEDYRETVGCLRDVVENVSYPPTDDLHTIVTEATNLLRLLIQKNEDIATCEGIGGYSPSPLDLTRIRMCLAGVEATTGVQIAFSTFRTRQTANRVRGLVDEVCACVEQLVPKKKSHQT